MDIKNIATAVLHGVHQESPFGALAPPIVQSSTFVFDTANRVLRFAGKKMVSCTPVLATQLPICWKIRSPTLKAEKQGLFCFWHGAISSVLLTLLSWGTISF